MPIGKEAENSDLQMQRNPGQPPVPYLRPQKPSLEDWPSSHSVSLFTGINILIATNTAEKFYLDLEGFYTCPTTFLLHIAFLVLLV